MIIIKPTTSILDFIVACSMGYVCGCKKKKKKKKKRINEKERKKKKKKKKLKERNETKRNENMAWKCVCAFLISVPKNLRM
jgi:hypothetical protein